MNKKLLIGITVFAVLTIAMISAGGRPSPLLTEQTLKTPVEKIYVAVEGTGEIAVLDTKEKTVIRRIDLSLSGDANTLIAYMPHNVQVAPDGSYVWVTANAMSMTDHATGNMHEEEVASADDQVIVIDPKTDTIAQRIPIGKGLHLSHVVVSPKNDFALVAAQEKGMIYTINTSTFAIEKEIATHKGAEPHGLRLAPDGSKAYIAMLAGKSLGILDTATLTLTYTPLIGAAVQTAVTPDGHYVLATIYDKKTIAVFSTADQTLSYVNLPQEAQGPVQLYTTPDSQFAYVADQGHYFDQPQGNTVYIMDIRNQKIVGAVKAGEAPHGVVVSRDGLFAYVTNLLSSDVSVIDTTLRKEVARIRVGTQPNGISIWSNSLGKTP